MFHISNLLTLIVFSIIGFYLLYWTIRLAVKHGLADHARGKK
ncbi:hypothetical protein [Geomicrobium sp. JCM 19039]|nr:hypothetical protein [Geomicrobium sp. JCM 19039]